MRSVPLTLLLLFAPGPSVPQAAEPSQRRITLDLDRADLHHVLRMLAEVGRLNLVVSDEVAGKVTLKLRNVTWRQALKVVLDARGLGHELQGNVLRVEPLSKLAEETALRARLKQGEEKVAPLRTFLIRVNYASATEMAAHVKPLLTERGSVTVDARTSTLIIRDVEAPAVGW